MMMTVMMMMTMMMMIIISSALTMGSFCVRILFFSKEGVVARRWQIQTCAFDRRDARRVTRVRSCTRDYCRIKSQMKLEKREICQISPRKRPRTARTRYSWKTKSSTRVGVGVVGPKANRKACDAYVQDRRRYRGDVLAKTDEGLSPI